MHFTALESFMQLNFPQDPKDVAYNKWQCQATEMTDGIYEDGCDFFDECESQHIHNTPYDTFPSQEPFTLGIPSFTHYTRVAFSPFIYTTTHDTIVLTLTPNDPQAEHVFLTLDLTNSKKSENPTQVNYSVGDFMRILIGMKGMYLKFITGASGVHYIWNNVYPDSDMPPGKNNSQLETNYNLTHRNALEKLIQGCFEIWGRPECLNYAVLMINNHIINTILLLNSYNFPSKYPTFCYPAPYLSFT